MVKKLYTEEQRKILLKIAETPYLFKLPFCPRAGRLVTKRSTLVVNEVIEYK